MVPLSPPYFHAEEGNRKHHSHPPMKTVSNEKLTSKFPVALTLTRPRSSSYNTRYGARWAGGDNMYSGDSSQPALLPCPCHALYEVVWRRLGTSQAKPYKKGLSQETRRVLKSREMPAYSKPKSYSIYLLFVYVFRSHVQGLCVSSVDSKVAMFKFVNRNCPCGEIPA